MTVTELTAAIDGLTTLAQIVNQQIIDHRKAGQISVEEQQSLLNRMARNRAKIGVPPAPTTSRDITTLG